MSLTPGTSIGRYVVRRKLAEGGMAEVYLCSSKGPEGFEKEVVIKRVRSALASDQSFVEMFIAEAQLASRLNHANVVQIFDFDKHEDTYYLAMEYVPGHSLAEALARGREVFATPSPVLAAHIAAEVARGLHHAHSLKYKGQPMGVVHRDVTPHNVLLSFDGAVKLADFGIAKAGNKLTVPGLLKGKFAYMSPEQSRGEAIDHRSDIFSLGIVVWEMLTGARLFDGDSDVAVLRAVQDRLIAPPARLNPDVPAELDAIVMKALERKREDRFQTAQQMEHELARFVLRSASGPEETDVGAYLRRLFQDGVTSIVAMPSSIRPERAAGAPGETISLKKTLAAPAEESPDEDVHAETFVVSRQTRATEPELHPPVEPAPRVEEAAEGQQAPPPRGEGAAERREFPDLVALPEPTDTSLAAAFSKRRGRWLMASGAAALAMGAIAWLVAHGDWGGTATPEDVRAEAPTAGTEEEPVAETAPAVEQSPAQPPELPQAEPAREPPKPLGGDPKAVSDATAGAKEAEEAAPTRQLHATESGPARSRPAAEDRASEQRPKSSGVLVLHVLPYAKVSIDGESIGYVEGTRSFSLHAGRHRLRLEHPKETRTVMVMVEPGRETEFRFQPK